MYKAVLAALLYIGIVIGGYTLYDGYFGAPLAAADGAGHGNDGHDAATNAGEHEGGSEEHGQGGHDEHAAGAEGSNQVSAYIRSDKEGIDIFLKDSNGLAVHDLVVNHEKLLHLIVVDEHLQKYYHLHPEQVEEGKFHVGYILPEGFYRAFIDIKSEKLAYHVEPMPLVVGNPGVSVPGKALQPDSVLEKTVEGESVKLKMSSSKTNVPVTLSFELDQSALTPYLGAMGHVVILDEEANQYLHVHPINQEEPVFQTEFKKPGVYKIWAEFQQNGKVRAFPFVVQIQGE
ncbi:hypothetical protein ACFSO0_13610 [Brevibacillus sp. GCM10020057]|uniref:hypothetical protein n=1 Tax=Brevibacillus sp. GCM10020057 TaxID=3317327 RepID=UPI00362C4EE5